MQTIRVYEFGPPDVLVLADAPIPEPGPGQLLIRVESAGVNFADVMRRRNDLYPFPTALPYAPGGEVAGTVESLGEGVAAPPLGTPVFALVGGDGSHGYAQFAVAEASQVVPIPDNLNADEACGIVVAGTAALLILKEAGRLRPGETVFVPGAAGGVGSYAVQLAKVMGAGLVVAAAGTPEKRTAALALGADHAVDSSRPEWPDLVHEATEGRGVDVLLEMAGGQEFARGLACLAPFGRAVVYGTASGEPIVLDQATIRSFFYAPSPNQSLVSFNLGLWFGMRPAEAVAALEELIGLVASGKVRIPVGHVLPLREAAAAHRLLEERRATGKVVLKPWVGV